MSSPGISRRASLPGRQGQQRECSLGRSRVSTPWGQCTPPACMMHFRDELQQWCRFLSAATTDLRSTKHIWDLRTRKEEGYDSQVARLGRLVICSDNKERLRSDSAPCILFLQYGTFPARKGKGYPQLEEQQVRFGILTDGGALSCDRSCTCIGMEIYLYYSRLITTTDGRTADDTWR